MKVFELFSGIGGMHFAFEESTVEYDLVRALDINTTANAVYRHNFPDTKLMENNIQCLTKDTLNNLGIEMLSMSPPCQPFTRLGLKKGNDDNRSSALKHILDLIPDLTTLKYVILENVVGFETSETRDLVTSVLTTSGFKYQEFILSPTQFFIPNSRNRYYLLATKANFCFKEKSGIHYELPTTENERILKLAYKFKNSEERCFKVENILEDSYSFLLPDKTLTRYADILDIVTRDCERTCCFTKGYSHYTEGTGSVFCPKSKQDVDDVYFSIQSFEKNDERYLQQLKLLEMRYFSPLEIARLMSFPATFNFPKNLTLKQQYRLLGNSINVHVVAVLILLLLCENN